MKPTAIVYTSNTGFTAEYAHLLGRETHLPVYSLADACKQLPAGSPIIYLGWLMAGKVQGYDKAVKSFALQAVCGVGMASTGSQNEDVRKTNAVAETVPVFTPRGGFDIHRLKGIYKFMMTFMSKTVAKQLEGKPNRTSEEDDTLDLIKNGGSRVSVQNLSDVIRWYQSIE